MPDVVSYAYRVPRFAIDLPLEFVRDTVTIHGHTCNLSETGALVRLQAPVDAGDAGRVCFRSGTLAISLEVEVTHADFPEAGLSFILTSSAERQLVRLLIRLAARNHRQI